MCHQEFPELNGGEIVNSIVWLVVIGWRVWVLHLTLRVLIAPISGYIAVGKFKSIVARSRLALRVVHQILGCVRHDTVEFPSDVKEDVGHQVFLEQLDQLVLGYEEAKFNYIIIYLN